MTQVEELHSIESWERACKESQERAVENRAKAKRRRIRIRAMNLLVVGVLVLTGTAVLLIALHAV